jgi:hypothetical protein
MDPQCIKHGDSCSFLESMTILRFASVQPSLPNSTKPKRRRPIPCTNLYPKPSIPHIGIPYFSTIVPYERYNPDPTHIHVGADHSHRHRPTARSWSSPSNLATAAAVRRGFRKIVRWVFSETVKKGVRQPEKSCDIQSGEEISPPRATESWDRYASPNLP